MMSDKFVYWRAAGVSGASVLSDDELEVFLSSRNYCHLRTDHYDLIISQEQEIVGFQLSIKNDTELAAVFSYPSEEIVLDRGASTVSIYMAKKFAASVSEIQDYCDIYIHKKNGCAVVLFDTFGHNLATVFKKFRVNCTRPI